MTPSTIAEFLHWLRPNGRGVTLTAIIPDGKTTTKTFTDYAEAQGWALRLNEAGQNLYFTPQPTRHPVSKKPTKEDIASVEFLFVDLDPRTGEDFESERARLRGMLNGGLQEKGYPATSITTSSGNGYNALWRLAEPILLDGDCDKIAIAEGYTREMVNRLGGDVGTHNIDRILRLPFTRNYPNKTKRAKGREPTEAKVYDCPSDEAYPLAAFPAPVVAPAPTSSRKHVRSTQERGSVPAGPYGVVELKEWSTQHGKRLPDTALAALVHGELLTDDDGKRVYQSGSEPTWAVCCGLARAGVPDELIVAAILDKNNGGAAHVLRQQKPTPYAWAQVTKARAAVEAEIGALSDDDVLIEMNQLHAVVVQGKVRVLSWIETQPKDDLEPSDFAGRLVVDLQSFDDFRNRYRNKPVVVGFDKLGNPKTMGRGAWWLDHERRREIKGLCFKPGAEAEIDGFQNLWRGWAVEPNPGDWSKMREHVRTILASGNEEHADYILKWTAWAVQNPARQAEVALVFRGGRGVGKGIFARAINDLFGQHGLHVRSSKHLTGDFNLHLRDCCLMFADEAIAPGDKGAESRLKGLITEPQLLIEGKGDNAIMAPNYLHIVMASNEKWVVPAGDDERRFAAFDVSDARQQDQSYFRSIAAETLNGGLAAMLYDLLNMDLGEWHPRQNVPQTDALRRQKVESLTGLDAYLFDLLCVGDFPAVETQAKDGPLFVSTNIMRDDAARWLRSRHGEQHVSGNDVSELMVKLGAMKHRKGGGGERGFHLPSLATMRAKWDALKFPAVWPTVAGITEPRPEQGVLSDEKPVF